MIFQTPLTATELEEIKDFVTSLDFIRFMERKNLNIEQQIAILDILIKEFFEDERTSMEVRYD